MAVAKDFVRLTDEVSMVGQISFTVSSLTPAADAVAFRTRPELAERLPTMWRRFTECAPVVDGGCSTLGGDLMGDRVDSLVSTWDDDWRVEARAEEARVQRLIASGHIRPADWY